MRRPRPALDESLLRLAFLCHPHAFRRAYADEMLAYYRDAGARERAGGPMRGTRFLISSILAAAREGLRQRASLRASARQARSLDGPRSGGLMTSIWYDLRFSVRTLVGHRQFTGAAVLLVTLGIGATTAVFSVFNAVLLRPLPYVDPDRLVAITSLYKEKTGDRRFQTSPVADLGELRRRAQHFESMGAFAQTQFPVRVGDRAFAPVVAMTDPGFLPTLGKPLSMGTFFDPALGGSNDATAIVSYSFWVEAFGRDPGVIGRTMLVSGSPHVVRGVMARDFQFPRSDASFFTRPIELIVPAPSLAGFPVFGIARLKPGVSMSVAQAELQSIVESLPGSQSTTGTTSVELAGLADETTRKARQPLTVVLAISVVLLIIACTNLMNLLFSRGVARLRELSIRRALGGTTVRLVRQLLTESLLVAAIGAALGVVLARVAIDALVALSPLHLPVVDRIDVDGSVLGYTVAICVGVALAAGLLPALHITQQAGEVARSPGMRASPSRRLGAIQQGLCIVQIALGVALLAGAGVLAHSLWKLSRVDPGFDSRDVFGFNVSVPTDVSMEDRQSYYAKALAEVRMTPGVEDAGLISFLPPETRAGVFMGLAIADLPPPDPRSPRRVNTLISSAGYFSTLRMPIVGGRDFTGADQRASAPVIIVNEAFGRRYLPEGPVVGRRIGTGFDGLKPVREIVGVVRDAHDRGLAVAAIPTVYIPFSQFALPYGSIAVRTPRAFGQVVPVIRERLTRLNPSVPLTDFQTIDDRLSASMRQPRFYTVMAAGCAGLAAVFVAFGLYGVVSYSVSRRRAELGIRMAIGADRTMIVRMVLLQGLRMAAAGVTLGLVLAVALSGGLTGLLFQVEPVDPLTLTLAGALVILVTLAASAAPARRAGRVNPISVLRYD